MITYQGKPTFLNRESKTVKHWSRGRGLTKFWGRINVITPFAQTLLDQLV